MEDFGGCLCIGCLEKRIGRKLKPKDFLRGHPFNRPQLPGTKRLLERRGRPRLLGASLCGILFADQYLSPH